MLSGLFFALLACFIWGTVFVIPGFFPQFSPIEVALGRYFFYGIISVFLFCRKKNFSLKTYSKEIWKAGALVGLFGNIIYYPAVIIGLRYATAPLTVLIAGLCPILIALYGNYKTKEFSFKKFLKPLLWIMLGILLVNAIEVDWSFTSSTPLEYLIGVSGAIISLLMWSIFAIYNTNFLKKYPDLPRAEWATIIGITTFAGTLLLIALLSPFGIVDYSKIFTLPMSSTLFFLLGTGFLGVVCSWIGCYLWNEACSNLPIALIGPLIIFETIFGLFFVFIIEKRIPSLLEGFGIVAMLWGIMSILQLFRKKASIHS